MPQSVRIYLPAIFVTTLVALAVFGAVGGTNALTGGKGPVADLDAGLSDAERMRRHSAARAEFESRITAWFESLKPSSLHLNLLEHHEILSSFATPIQDLDGAVKEADAIVVGTVGEVAPDRLGAVVTVHVQQALKGSSLAQTIRVRQASGVWPTPDWKGVFIADAPDGPLLLPGARVVLLLRRVNRPGAEFEVQSATGQYVIRAEGVKALEVNPFGSLVDDRSESAFVGQLVSAISRPQ